MPPQNDLVTFAQLDTSISSDGQAIHTFPDFDTTTQAPTTRREKWRRDTSALGNGAFGIVYRERCTSGRSKGELRAVKVMKKVQNVNYERELEAFSVFSQESLQIHHRFVRSTGWFETENEISIAMELVEHGNLETYLSSQGGKLPELDAQEITRQIFQALKAMHDLNFVHRDLKPGNVLIHRKRPDWWIKVADFGLSKRAIDDQAALITFAGTRVYMAPEMFDDSPKRKARNSSREAYTNAVDIWAAGVMAIQILQGSIPSLQQLMGYGGALGYPSYDPFQKVNVSSQARSFTRRVLTVRPERRPSATECSEDPWLQAKTVAPKDPMPREFDGLDFGKLSIKARPARKKPTGARNPITPRRQTAKPTPLTPPSALRPATAAPIRGMSRSPRPAPSLFANPESPHCSSSKFKSRTHHQGLLLDGHTAPVNVMVWDEYGQLLASASEDKTVRIWDMTDQTDSQVSTLWGHSKAVRALAFDDEGAMLASASEDGTILMWDSDELSGDWSYHGILEGHGGPVVSVSFSHDDKRLVSASSDRTVVEWDVATMCKVRTVKKFEVPVVSARCSRADDSLVVIYGGGAFDVAHGVQVWTKNKKGRKRNPWTMHRNHSFSSPVFSAFVLEVDELFAATSTGLVFKDKDSTEVARIDSECVIRAVLLDEPDDCISLAGSDWVAALRPGDVDNGSPFTKRYFEHGTPYAQGVATSDLLWVNGPVPSANDVQINPDSGETAFAFQGENSIFVLTKVPEPPRMRKRR